MQQCVKVQVLSSAPLTFIIFKQELISHKFFHFKISYDCWIKCKFNLDKFKNYLAKDLKNN
ncbi:hypothetical protein CV442_03420 [Campylobacter jejuni subsp. jejuni]|nr:hypothetical protein CV442_03420 [Campylobacter jejuni subsp. jejuni]